MTYAEGIERVVMLGGEAFTSWGLGLVGLGGAWAFDPVSRRWRQVAASNPRVIDVAAYDSKHRRVVAWASTAPADLQNFGFLPLPSPIAETWALDLHSGEWTNRQPAGPAPSLFFGGGQAVYDSRNDKFIMVLGVFTDVFFAYLDSCFTSAGCDFTLIDQLASNDVWAYDYGSNTWTRRQTAVSPPVRNAHGLAYDEQAGRVILFGGSGLYDDLDDTWAYDYATNTWEEMHPAVHPSARHYPPLTYDRENKVVVLYGGSNVDETILSDETWTYSYRHDRWTLKRPSASPGPRAWHDMAYDEEANAVVLFGGGVNRDSFTDETWIYRTAPDRWVKVAH